MLSKMLTLPPTTVPRSVVYDYFLNQAILRGQMVLHKTEENFEAYLKTNHPDIYALIEAQRADPEVNFTADTPITAAYQAWKFIEDPVDRAYHMHHYIHPKKLFPKMSVNVTRAHIIERPGSQASGPSDEVQVRMWIGKGQSKVVWCKREEVGGLRVVKETKLRRAKHNRTAQHLEMGHTAPEGVNAQERANLESVGEVAYGDPQEGL